MQKNGETIKEKQSSTQGDHYNGGKVEQRTHRLNNIFIMSVVHVSVRMYVLALLLNQWESGRCLSAPTSCLWLQKGAKCLRGRIFHLHNSFSRLEDAF